MVGVVRDIVIPLKGGTDPVFTIVCEILTSPGPAYSHDDEDSEQKPHVTRLWKMASAWRVISFFLVVFVLPTVLISLPLYARYHLYHARHLPMTETDTRALNHAVSSFWCQGQRVTSNGTLDAYLVAGSPRVQRQRRHVTLRRNLTLQHDDIEYWGVYLLEGSTFSLSSCARWPGGTMLVVKGEENLRKCFYRESRLEEQLNAGGKSPLPNVYKGLPDDEPNINDDAINKKLAAEEEEEEGGGEVYDDDEDVEVYGDDDDGEVDDEEEGGERRITKLKSRQKSQEFVEPEDDENLFDPHDDDLLDPNNDDLVPLLVEEEFKTHKYGMVAKPARKNKQKGTRRKNKKGKNKKNKNKENKNKEGRKERHGRARRSRLVERVRRDLPQSMKSETLPEESSHHPTLSEKLDLLHKFNDTLDVTTGNSSFSSSEEFLEQCRNTILSIDLTPYLDWQDRVMILKPDNPDSWHIKINSTDYYYFIFTSDNSIELNHLGFNLELERATYDISSPLETCRNATECIFPLAFTQTESVVVEVPAGEDLHELHSFEVTTTCQPRVPVYMVFILLVPFIILLFAFQ